jgi:hypothetical protein
MQPARRPAIPKAAKLRILIMTTIASARVTTTARVLWLLVSELHEIALTSLTWTKP